MKTYHVNEVFYSLQGEGLRAGTANVFLRFAFCNLRCSVDDADSGFDCDTEFKAESPYIARDLVDTVMAAWPQEPESQRACILTGGEPALQVDDDLVGELHRHQFYIAIETNGTRVLPSGIDWVCVSPKSAWHTIRVEECDELKLVRNVGQLLPKDIPIKAKAKLVSPAFGPQGVTKDTMDWCRNLVLENPDWRLSVQYHKLLGIR